MNLEHQNIRWIQRFENYKRAFFLLREIVEERDILSLSNLEKEGLIQRFEFTLELAWKTLKDKMQFDGILIDKESPRYVFKLAYQSHYIDNIEIWLQMVNDRNLMSHTYSSENFDKVLKSLQEHYFKLLEDLYMSFIEAQLQ